MIIFNADNSKEWLTYNMIKNKFICVIVRLDCQLYWIKRYLEAAELTFVYLWECLQRKLIFGTV